jgi:acetolactate synthase I/II/III large subunit
MSETVADAVADELAKAGIDRAFGLPGGEVLPLIDALRRQSIEFVLCRHEADAGLMAAVYGKLLGRPGVVIATLGPGASNLLLPVANSLLDREPLLAISAQVPNSWKSSRTHQRLPILDVFRPVTKSAHEITPQNCRSSVREMLTESISEPAGPTYLTLSSDVSRATVADQGASIGGATPNSSQLTLIPPDLAVSTVRARLDAAVRPVVVVGIGAQWSDAPVLRRWVSDWKLPVAVTPKAKGIVDETDPLFAGVVGGMAIDRIMVDGLGKSDLILGLGLDPTEIEGDWHERYPMLWVLESAWATNVVPADDLVATDMSAMLELLAEGPPPRSWTDPMSDARKERHQVAAEGADDNSGYISPQGSVRALAAALPRTTIVTTDVGSHKYLFGQFWPSASPGTFFMSNGLSGMGYGLPAAIGAKFARPDQTVLAVLGDGGFSMNSQELETARRYGLAIVVVVIADESYSMIRIGQNRQGLERYGVDFSPIDSVLIAEACGVRGRRVTNESELAECAREAAMHSGTTVIEVPMRADDYAPIV